MTHQEIFGKAKWVGGDREYPQQLLRGKFNAAKAKSAKLTITGLGFFAFYINGRIVTPDRFMPAWTDYERASCITRRRREGNEVPSWEWYKNEEHYERDFPITDETRNRLGCMQYDVTDFINEGENTIAISLGGGWYHRFYLGQPKACYLLQLTTESGEEHVYGSDTDMVWHPSYITKSQILRTEIHDYNIIGQNWHSCEFDDSKWESVALQAEPKTELEIQLCPADRVMRTVEPKLIRQNKYYSVYDVGENITGNVCIETDAQKGEKIELLYSEEVDGSGELTFFDTMTWGGVQRNTFITDGSKGLTACGEFTWNGFRYFSVTNNAKPLYVEVIHADVPVASSWNSDNKILNWLYEAFIRTQLTNMHAGIPSDCPHREGCGYTGDGQNTIDVVLLTLEARKFYEKWIEDIYDCQDLETGHVQYTAPFIPSGGGPGGWGGAIAMVPYEFYRHFGDISVLEKFFPRIELYFDYLEAHSENNLVVRDEPWAWCLGEWCTPSQIKIPAPFVNNYYYVKCLEIYVKIAHLLGQEAKAEEAKKTIAVKKQAIVENYFDAKSGDFCGNIQGANAFAFDIDLGDERTLANMVAHYSKTAMYDTGIFGTEIVTKTLFANGCEQLAFELLTSKEKISFYSHILQGATTLWEYWNGTQSRSHPMFGAVVKHMFYGFLGIGQKEGTVGFGDIVISPKLVEGMNYCEGSAKGVHVKYVKDKDNVVFSIDSQKPFTFVYDGVSSEFSAGAHTIVKKT